MFGVEYGKFSDGFFFVLKCVFGLGLVDFLFNFMNGNKKFLFRKDDKMIEDKKFVG